jgi:hypothetical protein
LDDLLVSDLDVEDLFTVGRCIAARSSDVLFIETRIIFFSVLERPLLLCLDPIGESVVGGPEETMVGVLEPPDPNLLLDLLGFLSKPTSKSFSSLLLSPSTLLSFSLENLR